MAFGRLERTTGAAADERDQRDAAGRRDAGAGGDLHHHRAAAGQLELRLDLPASDAATPGEAPQFVTVALDAGRRALPGRQAGCSPDTFDARVAEAARAAPETEVQLRADQAVPYGRVVEVMGRRRRPG